MIYDLQKASLLKRISAWLLDFILLTIVVTGVAWGLSALLNVNAHSTVIEEKTKEYEQEYGVSFSIEESEFYKLSEEEQKHFNTAYDAFAKDEKVAYAYTMLFYLVLTIATLSLLLAFLLVEFLPALLFGNGQTVGKRVFALGVMQINGIRVTPFAMFARAVLGKCTIETMIPAVLIILMLGFGVGGFTAVIVIGGILLLQLILLIRTRTNSCIHDVLAYTVVVDLHSQMIFASEAALMEYKQRIHAEAAQRAPY